MAGAHLETQARLVVSGITPEGRSTIVSDADSNVRVATPGFTVCELWQTDALPVKVLADSTLGTDPVIDPPAAGLVVRIASFPPDAEFDPAAYADSLDAFGVHAVGGIIGALLTGVFAQKIINSAGSGLIDGNAGQVLIQVYGILGTLIYDAVATLIILFILKFTIGLRVSEEAERDGLDLSLHGEMVQ